MIHQVFPELCFQSVFSDKFVLHDFLPLNPGINIFDPGADTKRLCRNLTVHSRNRLIVLLAILLYIFPNELFPQHFTRVNSGTRSDIRRIIFSHDGECFFLTDKIFKLKGITWNRIEFPENRRIAAFYPLSSSDIWFTIDLETSTSMLYHYHDEIIENVKSPLENIISSIEFSNQKTGFFSGYSEIAVWSDREFDTVYSFQSGSYILRSGGWSPGNFFVLSQEQTFLFFDQERFIEILPGKKIKDAAFINPELGYLISGSEVIEIKSKTVRTLCSDPQIKDSHRIFLSPEGDI